MKLNGMIGAVALVCGVAGSAAAQRGGRMGPMGDRGMGAGDDGPRAGTVISRQLMRGITLTDAQNAQLEKVRVDERTRSEAFAKAAQADREALRTARWNGDTVALNTARQRIAGQSNRRIAQRGELMRSVRGVLTQLFDDNRAQLERRADRAGGAMGRERAGMRRRMRMRRFAPGAAMRMRRGRGGFGPGQGMRMAPGRGGAGPRMQMTPGRGGMGSRVQRGRGPGGAGGTPPDSTAGGGN